MILLAAVIIGLLAGFVRAKIRKRSFQPVRLKLEWLIIAAILPQILVFFIPTTSAHVPNTWASIILVSSLMALFLFCLVNLRQPGFVLMSIGLLLNLLVISLNGGLMPIRPEILGDPGFGGWQLGERYRLTKDVVLPLWQTRFWFFSDFFITPNTLSTRYAFSLGDVILSIGVIRFFWSLGGPTHKLAKFFGGNP